MCWCCPLASRTEVSGIASERGLSQGAALTLLPKGMENPVYTYATPTIISGDRQNVDVIAHELSHSWSGNLVTSCSWEHL